MIKHVSLALNLRDGFKGRAISSLAGLGFTLEGQEIQPIFKEDGWCVFINLPKGEYTLKLSSRRFADRSWKLNIEEPEKFYMEEYATLEPTRSYPFGGMVRMADAVLTHKGKVLAEQTVYLTPDRAESPLKLAQDGAKAGMDRLRLFSPKKAELLALPDTFLVEDGAKSEIVSITGADGEGEYTLAAPLKSAHARGVSFKRVREHRTDAEGGIFLAFAEAERFTAYWEGKAGFLSAAAELAGTDVRLKVEF